MSPSTQPTVNWLSAALGLLALVVLAGLGLYALVFVVHAATGIAPAVLASLTTGAFALGVYLLQRRSEREKDQAARLRDKKGPIYEAFIQTVVGELLLNMPKDPNPKVQAAHTEKVVTALRKQMPALMIWGADPVVISWSEYWRHAATGEDPDKAMFNLGRVLLAIRKDLGHSGDKMLPSHILGMFVTDIDAVAARRPELNR
jgi:hypothetical protein